MKSIGEAAHVQLVNFKDAADMLGVSVRTVHRLRAAGALRVVKVGRSARLRLSDLVAYIDGLCADAAHGRA